MNPNSKSTKHAAPESPAAALADLFSEGMARFAAVEKSMLDLLVGQAAEAHSAWKRASLPGAPAAESAVEGLKKLAEAQKSLLDLAAGQSAQAASTAKERADAAVRFGSALKEMARQSAGHALAVEKIALDYAAMQNGAVTDSFKREFGLPETSPAAVAADSIRRGADIVLKTQKELLDVFSKPFLAASNRG
jgi:hypothetical protein